AFTRRLFVHNPGRRPDGPVRFATPGPARRLAGLPAALARPRHRRRLVPATGRRDALGAAATVAPRPALPGAAPAGLVRRPRGCLPLFRPEPPAAALDPPARRDPRPGRGGGRPAAQRRAAQFLPRRQRLHG